MNFSHPLVSFFSFVKKDVRGGCDAKYKIMEDFKNPPDGFVFEEDTGADFACLSGYSPLWISFHCLFLYWHLVETMLMASAFKIG